MGLGRTGNCDAPFQSPRSTALGVFHMPDQSIGALSGEPDMQMVVRGDHIGADDP
jgi:hypothetical protein